MFWLPISNVMLCLASYIQYEVKFLQRKMRLIGAMGLHGVRPIVRNILRKSLLNIAVPYLVNMSLVNLSTATQKIAWSYKDASN